MKIIQLKAENIKKLQAVEITPAGSLVQISGPNGSGKTSVLDSIYWALAGTKEITSQPVRSGEQKASIVLDLGEIVVTRKFTANGGTTLNVEAADGARFSSPQKMLDDLLGSLTFDPLGFTRMAPKDQLNQLRSLVTIEVDIDALDRLNASDFEKRTEVNREAKQLEAQVAAIAIPASLPADAEPIDVSALLEQIQTAAEHNASLERRKAKRAEVAASIVSNANSAATKREQAAALIAEAEALEQQAAADQLRLENAEALPAPIDVADVRGQVEAANAANEQIKERSRRNDLVKQHTAKVAVSDSLTAAMDVRKQQRADAIAAAAMPVPGLSFGEGQVLYNDLPFDQASGAEQLRVSVAIAMAANPKLRVLRIKDGSLLDENGLQLISEMADANDYQVWIERVDTSGKVGIVMEDGHVREVHQTESAA